MPDVSPETPSASATDVEPDPEPPSARPQHLPPQQLTADIVDDFDGWAAIPSVNALVQAAATALLAEVDIGTPQATVAVLLTSDAEVRSLNAKWRGIDKATNVLSFPAPEAPGDLEQVEVLGDIALACETVLREAAELGTTPAHHLQHLVVHGLLHLLGYDHENADEATEMEAIEVDILARLGIADPYAGQDLVGAAS
jgi:probable rRNA maturation factor